MYWKTVNKISFKNLDGCVKKLRKKYILSHWIRDIAKRNKSKNFNKNISLKLYRITVKDLGFKKPTKLMYIYNKLKKLNYEPIPMQYAIYLRFIYDEQPNGEWLRILVPLKSMIDSDGVPHLPKLGKGLKKYFIETYWSYPGAIFHPHNDFIVKKK